MERDDQDYLDITNRTPIDDILFGNFVNIAGAAFDRATGAKRDKKIRMFREIMDECNRRFAKREADEIAHSFLLRFEALGRAVREGRLKQFAHKVDGESHKFHDAVYRAAAKHQVDSDGCFDANFIDRIQAIIDMGDN